MNELDILIVQEVMKIRAVSEAMLSIAELEQDYETRLSYVIRCKESISKHLEKVEELLKVTDDE